MTVGPPAGSAAPGPLARIVSRGAGLATAGVVAVQCITVVQTLVLARLLSPQIVGVFAAATVLTTVLAVFTHGTLAQALIQREHDLEDATTTVFWVTLGTGMLSTLALLAVAPLLGLLFHSGTVATVAAVMSGSAVLTATTSVPDALMQRRFQFKRRVVVDPAVAAGFAVCATVLAALGCGVWALVAGTYVSLVVWNVASWWLARCTPFTGRFSVRIWREMAVFSIPLLLDELAFRLQETVELTIVGRGLSEAALGNYRYGRRIALLPATAVVQVCSYVLFPAFSRIAGEAQRFRAAFLRALGWIWRAAVPLAGLMIALGEPAVRLVLGEPWREAGVAVAAMAGLGLGVAVNSVTAESLKGAGRSARMNWMTAVGVCTGIPLMLLLLPLGLFGIGLAVSVSALAVAATGLAVTCPVVGVSRADLVRVLVPPVVAGGVALAPTVLLERGLVHAARWPVPVGLAFVALEATLFLGMYLAALRVLAPSAYREITDAVRTAARRLRRHRAVQ